MKRSLTPIPSPTRREFCAYACRGASLLAAGVFTACGGSPTSPSNATPLSTVSGSVSGRTVSVSIDPAGALASVGSAAILQTSLGTFLVAHTAQDTFSVLSAICTHESCTITGFSGSQFVCPCHGSQFTTSGGVANGPATRSLPSFASQFSGGVLTFTAGIVYGFVKTRPELEEPNVQYHFTHASYATAQTRVLDRQPGMTLTAYQCSPASKGSIHAKSADPLAAPAIRPNFLSEELDRRTIVEGMKIGRRIINNPVLDKYRAFEMNPGDGVQTDDEWLDFARINGQTTYHVTGTCKMGHDPMAVVDDELRVHGVAGLRVIDASIMPTLVSGNTNAAVIMIAEKGADMILEDARAA